eukprot:scaffold8445_cov145-Skeletonema_marinoi.AAC.2
MMFRYWDSNPGILRERQTDLASRAMAKDALESEWILGLEDDALIEHELRESLDGITETRANI